MTITQNYKNAFTEVYTILNYIEDDDYEKIPQEVLEVIEENRNQDYEYEMNEEVDIFNQQMLPETKAILFNFFRDYWSTPEQNEKINRMQREEMQKNEEKKKLEYGEYNVFENIISKTKENEYNEGQNNIQTKESTSLVKIRKDNFFNKIINRIKDFFNN